MTKLEVVKQLKEQMQKEDELIELKQHSQKNSEEQIIHNQLEQLTSLPSELSEWLEYNEVMIKKINSSYKNNEATAKHLRQQITDKELELNDIRHIIELGNFNASQGYKLSKLMQEVLQERRKIKTQLDTCNLLNEVYEHIIHIKGEGKSIKKKLAQFQKPMNYSFRKRNDLKNLLELKTGVRTEILKQIQTERKD